MTAKRSLEEELADVKRERDAAEAECKRMREELAIAHQRAARDVLRAITITRATTITRAALTPDRPGPSAAASARLEDEHGCERHAGAPRPPPLSDAEIAEADRVSECKHGIEGAAADPATCSACVWDDLSPEARAALVDAPAFRPRCCCCGERWLPPEGVDAQVTPCPSCRLKVVPDGPAEEDVNG